MDIERPLDDDEITRLEEALAGPAFKDAAMPLDAMQGFFAAIVSGPRAVPSDVWLPVVLGESPGYASLEEADDVESLLLRLHAEVSAGLYTGEGFAPILPRESSAPAAEGEGDPGYEPADYADWCLGYLEGMECWAEDLDALLEAEPDLEEPLLAIEVLAGDHDEALERLAAERETTVEAMLADCAEGLFADVQDIYEYWSERRKGETVRRETPKVGRNDPCPCGSGRKWKHCHGAH